MSCPVLCCVSVLECATGTLQYRLFHFNLVQKALRFRHYGHHFLKLGDSANISFSKILHFVQSVGL
jgi:hypothetical protein